MSEKETNQENANIQISVEEDHSEDPTVSDQNVRNVLEPKFELEKEKAPKTRAKSSTAAPEKRPEKEKKAVKIKKVNDLKDIINEASQGNKSAIKKLIKPFLGSDEVLITSGISGEFGVFMKVYNFYFLTNQRVGDITITPFTGELNIEVAFLDDIKSYTIVQPHISITFKLLTWSLYPFIIGFFLNSSLKRVYLKYKKSGLFIKFGDFGGTHIFFDRERFSALANLSNTLNNARKRIKG